jgi:Domain of unknown function (DUF4833)
MPQRRARRASTIVSAAGLMLLLTASVSVALPVAPVQSIFFIAKSENKNQVHYAVNVDADCRPVGTHPVYGYWRDLELGPRAVSKLLDHEQRAYGLGEPRFVRASASGGQIRVALRALPERPLFIDTFRQGKSCAARTQITIAGQPALLESIYVDLGFLFSVNYILLHGVRVADGAAVSEKIHE